MNVRTAFRALVYTATVLALVVVVFGAFVRLSDAGLGCPDWPGCYGHVSVPKTEEALARAVERFPDSVVESRKAWIEMIHRYLAGTLGVLVLGIAIVAWRRRGDLEQSPVLPTALVALIIVQAAFGMWTVTLRLMPIIVTLHLIGGMATLGLLTWLSARQSVPPTSYRMLAGDVRASGSHSGWALLALAALIVQLALGGWVSTNYAGMACPDMPLCHGQVIPPMDFPDGFALWRQLGFTAAGEPLSGEALTAIQWSHRIWAVVTLIVLLIAGRTAARIPSLRASGITVIALALIQVSIGIANVVYVLPVPLAVAHNAGAALLLITLVVLNSRARSALRPEY
ncbi:MAG: COX15/CtaA family protein [Burkholderiales bacterium]|nr:COX15/CtaA family protein [Burkholderiales bacterium]